MKKIAILTLLIMFNSFICFTAEHESKAKSQEEFKNNFLKSFIQSFRDSFEKHRLKGPDIYQMYKPLIDYVNSSELEKNINEFVEKKLIEESNYDKIASDTIIYTTSLINDYISKHCQ